MKIPDLWNTNSTLVGKLNIEKFHLHRVKVDITTRERNKEQDLKNIRLTERSLRTKKWWLGFDYFFVDL